MLEIELKFPVADFGAIENRLQDFQAVPQATLAEADHYFNAPDRDFGRTDEAFRLRRIGAANRITYKGPKQGGPTKTRTEIEIGIESGALAADDFCRLVQHLGYRPTAIVQKQRTIFEFTREGFALQVCLDEVETLGKFVEVEIVADPALKRRADEVLLQVARDLGLEKSEPRSYLEMVLAKANKPLV